MTSLCVRGSSSLICESGGYLRSPHFRIIGVSSSSGTQRGAQLSLIGLPGTNSKGLYRTARARELSILNLKYKSCTELEESVELVGQAIRLAYESSCTVKVPKGKQGASGDHKRRSLLHPASLPSASLHSPTSRERVTGTASALRAAGLSEKILICLPSSMTSV